MSRAVVVLVLAAAACGEVDEAQSDAAIDARPDLAPDQADGGLGAWGTPIRIMELATISIDQDATLTPDLLEMIFASNRDGTTGVSDLWSSTRSSVLDPWGAPSVIPIVNSVLEETQPYLTPDGLRMYFSSSRTGGVGLNDIYVTVRATRTSAWAAPTIVPELSSASDDQMGGLSADQLTVVFSSDRGGPTTMRDLYIATRSTPTGTFGVPSVASTTVTNFIESGPAFAGGGTAIYYVSNNDLIVAPVSGTTVGTPAAIAELNTANTDSDPWVSEDQRTMVFSHDDLSGSAQDLYVTTR